MKTDHLKTVSAMTLVFGIIGVLVMAMNFMQSSAFSQIGISWPAAGTLIEAVLGILMIVSGALGMRLASDPGKRSLIILLDIVMIVLGVVGLIVWFLEVNSLQAQVDEFFTTEGFRTVSIGGVKWTCFVSLALPVLSLIVAVRSGKSRK